MSGELRLRGAILEQIETSQTLGKIVLGSTTFKDPCHGNGLHGRGGGGRKKETAGGRERIKS